MTTQSSSPHVANDEEDFTFADRAKGATLKATLKQPVTLAALALMIAIGVLVAYLERGAIEIDLPAPEASYSLLPNQGRTDGVPIAIKLNGIAVFMINDPLQGGEGAARAKEVVDQLQEAVTIAVEEPGKTVRIDNDMGPLPVIVLTNVEGEEKRVIVEMQRGDLLLAGDKDAKRVARTWAERLTDTVKVLAFAEPPKFTVGTEFGQALEAMYAASVTANGVITVESLEAAFDSLPDRQKLALETLSSQAPEEVEPAEG